jgi:23S rRNA (guanosine2251-2'-O)-methyltransferase
MRDKKKPISAKKPAHPTPQKAKNTSKNITAHQHQGDKNNKPYKINAPKKSVGGHANDYLYGTHAVDSALNNPKRICKTLWVTASKYDAYKHYASKLNLDIVVASNDEITKLLPSGAVHQSVALYALPLSILSDADLQGSPHKTIMVLDNVTDPHNIGAILRVCAAFECHILIMHDFNAPSVTGVMAKSAAGAVELVEIVRVTNLAQTLNMLKKQNYYIYGADGYADMSLPDVKFAEKTVIVMGSEGAGIRRLVKQECDVLVSIPMAKSMESLNVSVASGIILSQRAFGQIQNIVTVL